MHVQTLLRAWAALLAAAILPGVAISAAPKPEADDSKAASALVTQALEAELAGQNQQREALIAAAVRQAPNDPAARWHGGQLWFEGAWRSPAEVPSLAQKDGRLADYRQRRDAAGPTPDEQAELARWCRRNKLDEEQRVHWLFVLQLQPNNAEAIKALRLQAFQGMLLPQEQVERLKAQQQQARKEAERWTPIVSQWRRAKPGDEFDRVALLAKFRAIDEPAEMMGLEQALWQQIGLKRDNDAYAALVKELAEGLHENLTPVATQFLARCAALGPTEEARAAAIASLKKRPLDEYVPVLLAGLRSPVDVNRNYEIDGAGRPITHCTFWQDGPFTEVSLSWSVAAAPARTLLLVGQRATTAATRTAAPRDIPNIAARAAVSVAATMHAKVEQLNQAIEDENARICEALRVLTGAAYADQPRLWWDWWIQKYNEYDVTRGTTDSELPSNFRKVKYEYEVAWVCPYPSCFARGTPVWTMTGLRPIEDIQAGDRVLAQDTESGELAYKPVLGVTIRPPGPRLKVTAGDESLVATPGHPFWVAGQGWRLTKQLTADQQLHTLEGALKIGSVEKAETPVVWHEGAYNLIVADFNTYFVGKRALLVHDNTPRQPTGAALPGLRRK